MATSRCSWKIICPKLESLANFQVSEVKPVQIITAPLSKSILDMFPRVRISERKLNVVSKCQLIEDFLTFCTVNVRMTYSANGSVSINVTLISP